jgi:hypothetical protein
MNAPRSSDLNGAFLLILAGQMGIISRQNMMRSKEKFYWSDALYLARTKNSLTLKEQSEGSQLFQCNVCSAFARFDGSESGHWKRIKPYEQFQLQRKFGSRDRQINLLTEIEQPSQGRKLYLCPNCASHWWYDDSGWNRADDGMVEAIGERK